MTLEVRFPLCLAALSIGLAGASCSDVGWGRSTAPALTVGRERVPVPPATKVVGLMFNYPPAEAGASQPPPGFFLRTPNSLASHGDVIRIPERYDTVLYEGELVIVIGKRASRVSPSEARSCILGYTCGMDGSPVVTDENGERDIARSLAGKSADGVAPVGPWVVPDLDVSAQKIELRVNGQVVERCLTGDLVWDPARVVSEISRTITLEPGDLIFTGASRAVPKFTPGDRVEVEISGIGTLVNTIAEP